MNRFSTHAIVGVIGAIALIVGGCATASMPTAQPADTPAYSAPASGFASPQSLFEKYPEMRRQAL